MRFPSRKGFVFTVDAFISLLLVLMTVFAFISILNIPPSFLPQFEQTHILARDGLKSMDNLLMEELWVGDAAIAFDSYTAVHIMEERDRNNTVLEELARLTMLGSSGAAEYVLRTTLEPVIPPQYGYRFEVYDKDYDRWISVSGRDKPLEKIQATYSRIMTFYSLYDDPRNTPFGYSSGAFTGTCDGNPPDVAVPCAARNFTGFVKGNLTGPTEVRLVVWI